jgi:hypothetical protein
MFAARITFAIDVGNARGNPTLMGPANLLAKEYVN